MSKRGFSLECEIIIIILGIYGLMIAGGVFSGTPTPHMFSYYTIISNIVCVVYMIGKVIYRIKNPKAKEDFLGELRGLPILGILLTGIVYHFLLGKNFQMIGRVNSYSSIGNLILHYIIPYAMLLDYLAFDKKGYFTKKSPVKWALLPFVYFIYVLAAGEYHLIDYGESYYPYYFVDVGIYGYGRVLVNAVLITIAYLAVGYIFYYMDQRMVRGRKKKSR